MSPLKDFIVNLGSFARWTLSLGVGVTADGSRVRDDVECRVEDVRLTSFSILVMAVYISSLNMSACSISSTRLSSSVRSNISLSSCLSISSFSCKLSFSYVNFEVSVVGPGSNVNNNSFTLVNILVAEALWPA